MNNPLRVIDPDGQSVSVKDGDEEVEYRDGKYYWKGTDKEYDGSACNHHWWTKLLCGGKYSGFLGSVYNSLNNIAASDLSGELNDLVNNNEINCTIFQGDACSYMYNTYQLSLNESEIEVTMDKQLRVSETNDLTIKLGHELGHAFDNINHHNNAGNDWFTSENNKRILTGEIAACKAENIIRQKLGYPIRAYYEIYKINNRYVPNNNSALY